MAGNLMRQEVPRKWPVERKGTTYIVRPKFGIEDGVPVLIILREITKLVQNRREAKRIIHARQILVNEKPVKDEKLNVLFLDTVNILPLKKCYRVELSDNGKFKLNEIKESEANRKVAKITNKKLLKGKKLQLNLSDGRNFLSDIKCSTNDSVLINLKDGKIEKCLPMKEKAKVIVYSGKHIGKKGEIISIDAKDGIAKVKTENEELNVLIKQLIVTE